MQDSGAKYSGCTHEGIRREAATTLDNLAALLGLLLDELLREFGVPLLLLLPPNAQDERALLLEVGVKALRCLALAWTVGVRLARVRRVWLLGLLLEREIRRRVQEVAPIEP